MAPDDLAIRGTAWLSLLAWAASEGAGASTAPADREARSRGFFTGGILLLLAHTGLALHWRHAWSQGDALREIARQTAEVTGVAFGGGLYVNYAFLAFWAAEAAWRWLSPAGYCARPFPFRWWSRGVFLFMFVNGAIVFGKGPVRVFGAVMVLAVLWSWYRARIVQPSGGREERARG